jgi:hypothetical protein
MVSIGHAAAQLPAVNLVKKLMAAVLYSSVAMMDNSLRRAMCG